MSGEQYRSVGGQRDELNIVAARSGFTFTFKGSFHLVREGSSDDLLVTVTFRFTENANGERTVEIIETDTKCVG